MSAEQLAQALRRIADWGECSAEYRVDYGSNGERDYYRNLAREALAAHEAVPVEPVLWVSPKQLEAHDPQSTGKSPYLPAMKRQEDLFTTPLYTHPEPQTDEAELRRLLSEERETTRQLVRALRDAIEEPVFMGEPVRTASPRFADVSCSQCAKSFGPGDAGFSHCEDHKHLGLLKAARDVMKCWNYLIKTPITGPYRDDCIEDMELNEVHRLRTAINAAA